MSGEVVRASDITLAPAVSVQDSIIASSLKSNYAAAVGGDVMAPCCCNLIHQTHMSRSLHAKYGLLIRQQLPPIAACRGSDDCATAGSNDCGQQRCCSATAAV
jgi:hypothetical protein